MKSSSHTPSRPESARQQCVSRVRVVDRNGRWAVVADEDFAAGAVVYVIDGPIVARPSRYSVQVGRHEHVEVPMVAADGRPDRRSVWCFLNHACEPTANWRGRLLVALRPILRGEEITFDYDTTEWDMASPFPCECGAAGCRGVIRGFRRLTAAQQMALRPFAAAHLLDAQQRAGS